MAVVWGWGLLDFGAHGSIRQRRLKREMEPAGQRTLQNLETVPSSRTQALCCWHVLPLSARAGEVCRNGVGLEGSLFWLHRGFAPSELNLKNSPLSHHVLIITSLFLVWENRAGASYMP